MDGYHKGDVSGAWMLFYMRYALQEVATMDLIT